MTRKGPGPNDLNTRLSIVVDLLSEYASNQLALEAIGLETYGQLPSELRDAFDKNMIESRRILVIIKMLDDLRTEVIPDRDGVARHDGWSPRGECRKLRAT